ncbi:uncharacterized protein SEPMUDRAFT_149273 [Sphaerulina musiva SO2202]|uniref:Uncharacterized protein n=1 Tax=Sphaerulina musiva (strain SO2202) TaxID=692275 RepID=M3D437_SPHMS|nr:uncharacterized protein SEPMUDRAFT_149273 [Sphaerulina musiva SO2202]EMF12664.1 hypothetical protein SEPMUDRAFT_149273 [Sphaerulina musiva SO2202]
MCRHDDQLRPTFSQILKRARKFVSSPNYPARGLREAPASDPRYVSGPYHLRLPSGYKGDKYPLGLALNTVPMDTFLGSDGRLPSPPASRGDVGDDEDSIMSDDLGGGPAVYGRPHLAADGSV